MSEIAVLITCFNRKEKTLSCLKRLSEQEGIAEVQLDTFIVDGGSSDGTPKAVKAAYPQVHVSVHPGLYWAGGMRQAWKEACEVSPHYDFFLLLNDDTVIDCDCIQRLLKAQRYAAETYGKTGICVGATISADGEVTYGGSLGAGPKLSISKAYQVIDRGNANIMLVSRSVYDALGGLSDAYTHGLADFDYTLRAHRSGWPVLLIPGSCGVCENDHKLSGCTQHDSLRKRIEYLYSPKGLAYKEYLHFVKQHYPRQYATSFVKLWLRTLFPGLRSMIKKDK